MFADENEYLRHTNDLSAVEAKNLNSIIPFKEAPVAFVGDEMTNVDESPARTCLHSEPNQCGCVP
jgi:hypothetical protein